MSKWTTNIPRPVALSVNHGGKEKVEVFIEDVRSWLKNVIEGRPGYTDINPDHIHLSPPCQGFSTGEFIIEQHMTSHFCN